MASVRSPTSMVSSNLVTGSMATHTQWGDRGKRWIASASLTSPAFTALSMAKSAPSCPWVTRGSGKNQREKAAAWSTASTNYCSIVFVSTSNIRPRRECRAVWTTSPWPIPAAGVTRACHTTACYGYPGKSCYRRCSAIAVRARHSDDRWRRDCRATPSHHSHSVEGSRSGSRCSSYVDAHA